MPLPKSVLFGYELFLRAGFDKFPRAIKAFFGCLAFPYLRLVVNAAEGETFVLYRGKSLFSESDCDCFDLLIQLFVHIFHVLSTIQCTGDAAGVLFNQGCGRRPGERGVFPTTFSGSSEPES